MTTKTFPNIPFPNHIYSNRYSLESSVGKEVFSIPSRNVFPRPTAQLFLKLLKPNHQKIDLFFCLQVKRKLYAVVMGVRPGSYTTKDLQQELKTLIYQDTEFHVCAQWRSVFVSIWLGWIFLFGAFRSTAVKTTSLFNLIALRRSKMKLHNFFILVLLLNGQVSNLKRHKRRFADAAVARWIYTRKERWAFTRALNC